MLEREVNDLGERRMVSRKIVESAKFLKMPATSQNLYFHLLVNRIALSGLPKGEFFINSCIHNEIHITGNIKTFDEIKNQIKNVDEHLCSIQSVEELDLERLESLRTILEILDSIYGKEG